MEPTNGKHAVAAAKRMAESGTAEELGGGLVTTNMVEVIMRQGAEMANLNFRLNQLVTNTGQQPAVLATESLAPAPRHGTRDRARTIPDCRAGRSADQGLETPGGYHGQVVVGSEPLPQPAVKCRRGGDGARMMTRGWWWWWWPSGGGRRVDESSDRDD